MADINNDDNQAMVLYAVDNSIIADAVGVAAFQFAFQRLTKKGVQAELIKHADNALIQSVFALCHAHQSALGLTGDFKMIAWQ